MRTRRYRFRRSSRRGGSLLRTISNFFGTGNQPTPAPTVPAPTVPAPTVPAPPVPAPTVPAPPVPPAPSPTLVLPIDMFERKYAFYESDCRDVTALKLNYTDVLSKLKVHADADKNSPIILPQCPNAIPINFLKYKNIQNAEGTITKQYMIPRYRFDFDEWTIHFILDGYYVPYEDFVGNLRVRRDNLYEAKREARRVTQAERAARKRMEEKRMEEEARKRMEEKRMEEEARMRMDEEARMRMEEVSERARLARKRMEEEARMEKTPRPRPRQMTTRPGAPPPPTTVPEVQSFIETTRPGAPPPPTTVPEVQSFIETTRPGAPTVPEVQSDTLEGESTQFVNVCRRHMMNNNLDSVARSLWMQKDDCNVFILGERHQKHTKCKSIYDMFNELLADLRANKIKIDLLLEQYAGNDYGYNLHTFKPYRDEEVNQIQVVRDRFYSCIHKKNCPYIHVHWTDSTRDDRTLPKWLRTLALIGLSTQATDDWMDYDSIKDHIKDKGDLIKLLTANTPVMKEIDKASKVNPKFDFEFAKDMFESSFKHLKMPDWQSWHYGVKFYNRIVIDIYAIARLVKLKMKNVIIYAGYIHARNCQTILKELGFTLREEVIADGSCSPPEN
jgi:hypothetical protein